MEAQRHGVGCNCSYEIRLGSFLCILRASVVDDQAGGKRLPVEGAVVKWRHVTNHPRRHGVDAHPAFGVLLKCD